MCTQFKQANLEDWIQISTKNPKEHFNDASFQYSMDEITH